MPADFVQLPNSKGLRDAGRAYVRKPIADDLPPVLDIAADRGRLFNTILEIERQGMALLQDGEGGAEPPYGGPEHGIQHHQKQHAGPPRCRR